MDNSISPVYASLYTASSLARAAAEAGQRQRAPVESPAAAHRGASRPLAEDRGAALLLERSQYQASLNARLGFALQQTHSLEAGSGGAGTGLTPDPFSPSHDGKLSLGPGLGPVNQIVDDLRNIQETISFPTVKEESAKAPGNGVAPAMAHGRSGAESSEAVERHQDVTGQWAETGAPSAGTAAAGQPIADERVVLTHTGVSLSSLLDQVTRVFSGALGELLGDVLRAQGSLNPAQPKARSNPLDRRVDLYRSVSSSLSRSSRLDAKERTL